MLSSLYRFHGYSSLRYVYKNGQVSRGRLMTFKTIRNERRKNTRVAVVVSKKTLKSAVGRNRIRRRLYELLRAELPLLQPPYDIVCIVTSAEVKDMPVAELGEIVKTEIYKTGLYKNT